MEAPDCLQEVENCCHILTLNHDCLFYICQQLNPKDQLNFALTCAEFAKAFLLNANYKFKKLEIKPMEYSQGQVVELLRLVGIFVEKLQIKGNANCKCVEEQDENFCDEIIKYLKSANIIEIFDVKIPKISKQALENLKQLRELTLSQCNLTDECILALSSLQQLEKLNVEQNGILTGEYLCKLTPNLQHLNLSGCSLLSSENMISTCRQLQNLKILNISFCKLLVFDVYEFIASCCVNLEHLSASIQDESICLPIAKIKNLNKITLYRRLFEKPILKHLLTNLALHNPLKVHTIEVFGPSDEYSRYMGDALQLAPIPFLVYPVSDDDIMMINKFANLESVLIEGAYVWETALLHMIRNCPRLQYVDICNSKCEMEKFITLLLAIRDDALSRSRNILVIKFYDPYMAEWSPLIETKPWLNIDYTNTTTTLRIDFAK